MRDDLNNLLDNVSSGTIFLDRHLIIRRYTREALTVYPLITTDIGRSLSHIKSMLEGDDLLTDLRSVLKTLNPSEREVRSLDGTYYLARMKPYRTIEKVIAGVVLSFINITAMRLAQDGLRLAEEHSRTLLAELPVGVLQQSPSAAILSSNPRARELLGLTEDQLLGKTSFSPEWNVIHEDGTIFPGPTHPAVQAVASGLPVRDVVMGVYRPTTQDRVWLRVNAIPIFTTDGGVREVICTFADITATRERQRARVAEHDLARELAEGIVNTVSEPLIVLDGNLQVVSASRSFFQHFQVNAEATVGRKIYDLGNGQWNIPALRQLLENILPNNQEIDGYIMEHNFPMLGLRRMMLNARRIVTALGNTELILLAMVAIDRVEST